MSSPIDDPVLRSARREMILAFAIWGAALAYTVGYCYTHGYNRSLESLTFVLGFPDWVFWGIIAPWSVCIGLSFFYGGFFMTDVVLEEDPEKGANKFEIEEGRNG